MTNSLTSKIISKRSYCNEKFSLNNIHVYLKYPPNVFQKMIDTFFTESFD